MKANEKIVVVMFRYNPQLGYYCTIKAGEVIRVYKKSMLATDYIMERKFDIATGWEINMQDYGYGTMTHRVFTYSDACSRLNGNEFDGYRISYGKEVLQEV